MVCKRDFRLKKSINHAKGKYRLKRDGLYNKQLRDYQIVRMLRE